MLFGSGCSDAISLTQPNAPLNAPVIILGSQDEAPLPSAIQQPQR